MAGRVPAAGGSRALRWLRIAAALLLVATALAWTWFAIDGEGREAVQALSADPPDAPVEVLAAPRVLQVGRPAALAALERELLASGYRRVAGAPRAPGEFAQDGAALVVFRRGHEGPLGEVPEALVRATLEEGVVAALERERGRPIDAFALEPVRLGAFRGPLLAERQPLPIGRFPPRALQAVMAAEDGRFLRHRGIDPIGILRAVWADLRGGALVQGGSTITQQVIKNRIVGRERTILRKAREAILAAYVEGRIGKDRLLEIYLNEVYLGQRGAVSVVGLPAAARHYFGRNLDDLALHQYALLAGLIASPGRFDPRDDEPAARARMRWVLGRMAELEFIGEAEAEAAGHASLGLAPLAAGIDPAGDVLDAIRREAVARGWEPRPGPQRARVFSTIDAELQAAARRALDAALATLEEEEPSRRPLEGAVVVLRPATGELLALVGGRGGQRGAFHRALDARRQPGSAFKPFVALAALESRRYSPSSVLDDAPLTAATGAGPWSPQNYDGRFRGRVTLREALEQSLNVPFARLGLDLGAAPLVEVARRAGIEGKLPRQPSLALGTGEVAPLELAAAFGTLANQGTRIPPTLVRGASIGTPPQALPLAARPPRQAAFAASDCWQVLDMMAGVVVRGTGRNLAEALGGTTVAAKTGTTQDGRDAWFVLANPQAVVVVYVGRDDFRPAKLTGAGGALPVVARLLAEAGPRILAPLPPPPEGFEVVEVCTESGGKATARCPSTRPQGFAPGDVPRSCPVHAGALRRFWDRITGRAPKAPPTGQQPGAQRR